MPPCLNNRRKEEKYFGSEFQLRGAVSGTTSIPRALEKRRFRLERFQLCIELSWCQPYTCCAISVLARTAGSMFTVVMLKTRDKVNTKAPKYSPFLKIHHLIFQLCIELSWCQPYTCCAISAMTAGSMFTVVMLKTREKVNTNAPKYSPFLNSHHLISFIKAFQQFFN